MKFNANLGLDNREISATFSAKKEDGESDFFENLFGKKDEIEEIVDEEDEIDDIMDEV